MVIKVMESIIIAFSMYSKIPMPRINWNEKNMKYSLVFFPLVGVVIGIIQYFAGTYLGNLGVSRFFIAGIMSVIPILITGGIHMDGYLDTIDGLHSYQDKEKKLEILKDPNSGAFAIIYGMVYMVLEIICWYEIKSSVLPYVCAGYVCSRTLSGLSVAWFLLAKNTGLAKTFQDAAHRRNVKLIMMISYIVQLAILIYFNPIYGLAIGLTSMLVFVYYHHICMDKFGGITGDLAGFFLQVYELMILFVMVMIGDSM